MPQLEDVNLAEVIFEKRLSVSPFSVVFLVSVRDQRCIMKVVIQAYPKCRVCSCTNGKSIMEEDHDYITSPKAVNWIST